MSKGFLKGGVMEKNSRQRFQEIVKVFASYGFGYLMESNSKQEKKSPYNLRKAIEELGPTFVKIGQILSTRSDILPKEYVNELVKLQDSVPAESMETLKRIFETSVNKKMENCFKYFNETPLASASVSQVHSAVLLDGTEVVVKIQRPDIYDEMRMDLAILKRILKFTNTRLDIKVVNPLEVIEEIEQTVETELDFLLEGRNMLKFRENNADIAFMYVPKLITDIWSDKIIVQEKIEGFKITDSSRLIKEGYDNIDVARKLALSYCYQVFDQGFFHADPHPGNILIYDGKLCFIDFGIVGTLDDNLKSWLNSAVLAIATRDKNKVVDCILKIGIKDGRIDRGELYEDVSYLVDMYLTTSLKNLKMTVLLQEVFEITRKNNIQFPKELVTLVRGLMILEGVIAEIDPELDAISVIVSYMTSKGKMGILKNFDKTEAVISTYEFIRDLIRLPTKSIELLNKAVNGKAQLTFSVANLEKYVHKIDTMVNRLTGGLIIAALLISSSVIVASKIGPSYKGVSIIGILGYGVATIFAMVLLRSMIKTGLFRTKDKKRKK